MTDVTTTSTFTGFMWGTPADQHVLQLLLADLLSFEAADCALTGAALLLGAPQLSGMRDNMRPPVGLSAVHESQRFWKNGSAPLGTEREVAVSQSLTDGAARFSIQSKLRDTLVGELETRLRFVAPDQLRTIKGATFSQRLVTPGAVEITSAPIEQAISQKYVYLAHDDNPIHIDDEAAKSAGLAGAVVPGMLLCALSEAVFAEYGTASAEEIKTRFMAAVPVGEAVRLVVVPRGKGDHQWAHGRVFCVREDGMIAAITDISIA
ncbi:MAG: hypothetical protein GY883_06750 [Shimia sp.]|nr:hypothetical protein [Shimia sp.]